MPPRSRRALLQLLGSGSAALLAGCETSQPSDTPGSTSTESPSPPATASPSPADTETPPDTSTVPPDRLRCSVTAPSGGSWPLPRRGPARASFAPAWPGFEEAPTVAWAVEPTVPPDSDASPAFGPPVVVDDALFVTNEHDHGPEVALEGRVKAFDADSGEARWSSEILRSPGSPAVWGDLVVVAAETDARRHTLAAFNRTDGSRRWTREFDADATAFRPADDHLYLALEEPSDRGTILALDAGGATVWRRDAAFRDHVTSGPTVGPDLAYVATRDGVLHALDREDGTARWRHEFQGRAGDDAYVTDVVATDCVALAVVDGSVRAVDAEGTVGWVADRGEYSHLATDGQTVYSAPYLGDGAEAVRALDAGTGERRWALDEQVRSYQSPVVAGDALYLTTDDGVLALDREDASRRWRTDGQLHELTPANGTLYGVGTGADVIGGALVALR